MSLELILRDFPSSTPYLINKAQLSNSWVLQLVQGRTNPGFIDNRVGKNLRKISFKSWTCWPCSEKKHWIVWCWSYNLACIVFPTCANVEESAIVWNCSTNCFSLSIYRVCWPLRNLFWIEECNLVFCNLVTPCCSEVCVMFVLIIYCVTTLRCSCYESSLRVSIYNKIVQAPLKILHLAKIFHLYLLPKLIFIDFLFLSWRKHNEINESHLAESHILDLWKLLWQDSTNSQWLGLRFFLLWVW